MDTLCHIIHIRPDLVHRFDRPLILLIRVLLGISDRCARLAAGYIGRAALRTDSSFQGNAHRANLTISVCSLFIGIAHMLQLMGTHGTGRGLR